VKENRTVRISVRALKATIMKLNQSYKLVLAAALGLAFSALGAQAQVNIHLHEQATFGPFVGGTNNSVSNNGTFDMQEIIKTGTPTAAPFNIVYQPTNLAPIFLALATDTLTTSTLTFKSTISPLNYFASLASVINYDFDSNGTIDLTQAYTIALAPYSAGGLTGVSYSIVPVNGVGNVTINGVNYVYASVVANNSGTLFDGSSTTASIQFQFLRLATPVPEPSTYAAFGVAALGGIVWLRRRRSGLSGLSALRS